MADWIPAIAAWGAVLLTGLITLFQYIRSTKISIQKELNVQRVKLYPRVQEFMSGVYRLSGGGWLEAMSADKNRLKEMMDLSNQFMLWGSDDTLVIWSEIVEKGQRGDIKTVGQLAELWAKLDLSMRKDLGYGSKITPKTIYPILFSPKTVERITKQLGD